MVSTKIATIRLVVVAQILTLKGSDDDGLAVKLGQRKLTDRGPKHPDRDLFALLIALDVIRSLVDARHVATGTEVMGEFIKLAANGQRFAGVRRKPLPIVGWLNCRERPWGLFVEPGFEHSDTGASGYRMPSGKRRMWWTATGEHLR